MPPNDARSGTRFSLRLSAFKKSRACERDINFPDTAPKECRRAQETEGKEFTSGERYNEKNGTSRETASCKIAAVLFCGETVDCQ